MKKAYYNENDVFCVSWLRALIKKGLITDGDVDDRSITSVDPGELRGYTQYNFFAGIGGWAYALSLAGWPDDRPVWTGSCPCQPFSQAGRKGGTSDERHLWPEFFRLIRECRPDTIFGEQVAGKDGRAWLDIVSADLEGAGYAVGSANLCAGGVGAPHIRQRLYFVADTKGTEQQRENTEGRRLVGHCKSDELADSIGVGRGSGNIRHNVGTETQYEPETEVERRSAIGELGNTTSECVYYTSQSKRRNNTRGTSKIDTLANIDNKRLEGWDSNKLCKSEGKCTTRPSSASDNFWSDCEWLPCRDGKARPVKPGTSVLASGFPNRVGLLRGFGNSIVPQVAAEFIGAFMDCSLSAK